MSYGRGHVKGTKREKAGSQDWYKAIAEAHIARIEAEQQALVATRADLAQVLADVQAAQSALAAYKRAQQGRA